jgi:hypothetical protein
MLMTDNQMLRLNARDIFNGFSIDIKEFKKKEVSIIRDEGTIGKYEEILNTLSLMRKEYIIPLTDMYLMRYVIKNDENAIFEDSDYKVFNLGGYVANGREWIYKSEIDDYYFIIDNQIKSYYKYVIYVSFDELYVDNFKIETMDDIHSKQKIQKYVELKKDLETVMMKGEYIKTKNDWDIITIDYIENNNEMELLIKSGYIIYPLTEHYTYTEGRRWAYMCQIKCYHLYICNKIDEYYKYVNSLNVNAGVALALLLMR